MESNDGHPIAFRAIVGSVIFLSTCAATGDRQAIAEVQTRSAASTSVNGRHTPLIRTAEVVLFYQRDTGGWPKNYDRQRRLSQEERRRVIAKKANVDSTIDNGATYREIRILAKAYDATHDDRFKDAVLRGVDYLLGAQYENGGWPQYFPNPRGYSKHITFNDNAMIGVLSLMRDIASNDRETFPFIPPNTRAKCADAVARGIACILKCQIIVDGRRTAWCAQHDEVNFQPRKARSYELPSLSGSESVGIVRFLMRIDDPSQEVIEAIEAAVGWLERSKLMGIKLVRVEDSSLPRGYDRVVVSDPNARPMWARFYDIETNKPIFCSRDGIPRETLAEISYERRNGYSWLGHYADDLLEDDVPVWRKRIGLPSS